MPWMVCRKNLFNFVRLSSFSILSYFVVVSSVRKFGFNFDMVSNLSLPLRGYFLKRKLRDLEWRLLLGK